MSRLRTNWDYQWGQVVGQAWADDAFRQRLLANPVAALQECGVETPSGIQFHVVEDAERLQPEREGVRQLVLPERPSAEELSEEELVGGVTNSGVAYCGCEWCRCHTCHACERCACGRC